MLNKRGSGKPRLRIAAGNFVVPAEENAEGASERTITSGKREGETVWEYQYGSVEAYIIGGKVHKHDEFGWMMEVNIADPENLAETQTLSMPYDNAVSKQLIKYFPNIDATKPVLLGVGTGKVDGKTFIYAKQGDETLKSHFTKDHKNGMPEPVKKAGMSDDDVEWDWTAVNRFLKDVAEKFFAGCEHHYDNVLKPQKALQQAAPTREQVAVGEDDNAPF